MKSYKEFTNESVRDKMVGQDMKDVVDKFISKEYYIESEKDNSKKHAIQMIERGDSYDDIYLYCVKQHI